MATKIPIASYRQTLANVGAGVPPLPEAIVPRAADRFHGGWALRDDGLAEELRRLIAALAG